MNVAYDGDYLFLSYHKRVMTCYFLFFLHLKKIYIKKKISNS